MTLPVEARLKEIYDQLPPSERALGDLIIDFPGVLATHPISELAERAKTSSAAATRLIKRLGYKNVQELRKQVRQARESGSPRYLNTFAPGNEGFKSGVRQHLDSEIQNLIHSFEAIDEEAFTTLVNCLATVDSVWIVGFGNSHMPAFYLRQQLIQLRDRVEVLPRSGQVLAKDLSELTDKDMVIVIGFRRRKEIRYRLLEYAKSIGTPSLYITDHSERDTSGLSDWTVRCRVQSRSLFDSYSAAYSILNYIAASLAERLGRKASKRLSQAEKVHAFLGEE